MNCTNCARIVTTGTPQCPHCGASLAGAPPAGSAALRPQVPPDGDPNGYREVELVDHDHTLRRLRTAWRAARGGQGQLVALVGENGCGRSRLIRELGLTIDDEAPAALWLVGQAYSHATYMPLHLLTDLLAPWTDDRADGEVTLRLAQALAALADGAGTAERWTLLTLAREAQSAGQRDGVPPALLAEALARALRRLAGEQPLVVILEDLEWSDAASLVVLDALLPRILQGAALVIYTHHADWSHDWPDIPRQSQLILGPLGRADSLRLIGRVAGSRALSTERSEAVGLAAGGNALLLEQATLGLLEAEERRDLARTPEIPTTIHQAIRARLALLPDDARAVLLAAAVIGPRFAYRSVAMVIETTLASPAQLDVALRELIRRRLITRWREGTYRFTHALIQESAYGLLRRSERQAIEARVADWVLTEGALWQRSAAGVIDDLAHRTPSPLPADEGRDEVIDAPTMGGTVRLLAMDPERRSAVLARIALADLRPDQRATIALCLQHGYSYAAAADLLGLDREEVRGHLYEARRLFKRLHDASALATNAGAGG